MWVQMPRTDLRLGPLRYMTGQGTVWTNTQESLNSSFLLCRNFLLVPGDLDHIKGHSGRERGHKVGKWVSLTHVHLVSDEILD